MNETQDLKKQAEVRVRTLIENSVSFRLVLRFFKGDRLKAQVWFCTRHPMLGDLVPAQMIVLGREGRLRAAIKNMMRGEHS